MPSIQENLIGWDQTFDWPLDGELWSGPWGTSTAQWTWSLLPRIQKFVPTGTILEIAPGHGRWTQFLKGLCSKLIVVDLSPSCIDYCRRRFSRDSHIEYHVNDGTSLDMIADRSVDFAFSFDSLVHAEAGVMKGYVEQIAKKLTEKGGGFIHHSNIGDFPWLIRLVKLSKRLALYGRFAFVRNQEHWRAYSMTARLFRTFCAEAGLSCPSQELINWAGTRILLDCLSTFVKTESAGAGPSAIARNPNFMAEAARARQLSKLYAPRQRNAAGSARDVPASTFDPRSDKGRALP